MGPPEDRVGRVGYGRHGQRGGQGRVPVPADLPHPSRDDALHGEGRLLPVVRVRSIVQHRELFHGRPLGVDGEPAAVGKPEGELHHPPVDPEVPLQHRGGKRPQHLVEDPLAGLPCGLRAGQHRRQSLESRPCFLLAHPPLFVSHPEALERRPHRGNLHVGLPSISLASRRDVGQAPNLAPRNLEPQLDGPQDRPGPRHHRGESERDEQGQKDVSGHGLVDTLRSGSDTP